MTKQTFRALRVKLVHTSAVLLLVSFLTLLFLDVAPGHPAYTILGEDATPEQVEAVTAELGLDEPLPVRYVQWLGDVVRGDLGQSFQTGQPVFEAIAERLPVTLQLALMALGLSVLVAIPTAVFTAYRSGGRVDRAWTATSSLMIAIPHFVVGLVLVYFFAVTLGWFPVTGWTPIGTDFGANMRGAVLPVLALASAEIAVLSRVLRADMLTTLQEDYLIAARSRGLPARYLLFRHALRPSSYSLLTLAGLSLGRSIGGAVVVEALFGLPGIGTLVLRAVNSGDLVMVQGITLFVALSFVILNGVVDLLYTYLDPRLRLRATA